MQGSFRVLYTLINEKEVTVFINEYKSIICNVPTHLDYLSYVISSFSPSSLSLLFLRSFHSADSSWKDPPFLFFTASPHVGPSLSLTQIRLEILWKVDMLRIRHITHSSNYSICYFVSNEWQNYGRIDDPLNSSSTEPHISSENTRSKRKNRKRNISQDIWIMSSHLIRYVKQKNSRSRKNRHSHTFQVWDAHSAGT